jgi:hypothetical protein
MPVAWKRGWVRSQLFKLPHNRLILIAQLGNFLRNFINRFHRTSWYFQNTLWRQRGSTGALRRESIERAAATPINVGESQWFRMLTARSVRRVGGCVRNADGGRLRFVEFQQPTLVEEPPKGDGRLHEIEYDGYRAELLVERGRARVFMWSLQERYRHALGEHFSQFLGIPIGQAYTAMRPSLVNPCGFRSAVDSVCRFR